MDQRRIGLHRLQRIEDRRQLLVLDLDQIQRLLRGVLIDGGDGGDLLADEAHAVARQHRQIGKRVAGQVGTHVRGRDDRLDAGNRFRPARVYLKERACGKGLRSTLPHSVPAGSRRRVRAAPLTLPTALLRSSGRRTLNFAMVP